MVLRVLFSKKTFNENRTYGLNEKLLSLPNPIIGRIGKER